MSDYPEAYAVFCDESGVAEWDCDVMFSRKTDADCHLESLVEATDEEDEQRPGITDMSRWHVVQLIPAPVVDRMIAEAEQRGRDAVIDVLRQQLDEHNRMSGEMSGMMAIANVGAIQMLNLLIRDLSGIEPGKGGE